MSDKFKALVINQEGENFHREIKTIDKRTIKTLNFIQFTAGVLMTNLNFVSNLMLLEINDDTNICLCFNVAYL